MVAPRLPDSCTITLVSSPLAPGVQLLSLRQKSKKCGEFRFYSRHLLFLSMCTCPMRLWHSFQIRFVPTWLLREERQTIVDDRLRFGRLSCSGTYIHTSFPKCREDLCAKDSISLSNGLLNLSTPSSSSCCVTLSMLMPNSGSRSSTWAASLRS